MKPKPVKLPNIVKLEEDYIYILKARNHHGFDITIDILTTMEKAEIAMKEHIDSRKNISYWMNEKGELEMWIEKKPVNNPTKKI